MKKAFFTVLILYFVISPSQQSDACFSENVDYKVLFSNTFIVRGRHSSEIFYPQQNIWVRHFKICYILGISYGYKRTNVMLYKMKKGKKIHDFLNIEYSKIKSIFLEHFV